MEIIPVNHSGITNNIIIRKDSLIPRCKICFEEENEEKGELISPCNCSGSIKYVHRPCLNTWRFNNINPTSRKRCEICKKKYIIKRQYPAENCFFKPFDKRFEIILVFYLLFVFIGFSFALILAEIDKATDYYSLNIIGFSSEKNKYMLALLKNEKRDSCFILYYYSLTNYIFNLCFITYCAIFPFFLIKRREIYLKYQQCFEPSFVF